MLRVLTLSTLYPDPTRLGLGLFVERQTRGLAEHSDIELKLVAGRGIPPWPLSRLSRYRALADLPVEQSWNGVEAYRPRFRVIPGTGGRFHAKALAGALIPLLDRLRDSFRFDVIDAEFFFPDGVAAVALGRRYGVPVSIKARGADIHYWGTNPATAHQVRDAARQADGLLAVSHALADDIAALGVERSRIAVHLTGIDRTLFAPRDRDAAKSALGIAGPLVLSTGALIPRKNHAMVIDAVASLPCVQLRIAGEGPERARLEAQIARSGAGDRIALLGSVPHHDLPQWVAAADVMALASTSEGLANAWIEALASGTPIVIPDAGGAREVVTAHAAGRIVSRTAAAFADAIGDLLENPPARMETAAMVADYSWERNRDQLIAHLAGLVQRYPAR